MKELFIFFYVLILVASIALVYGTRIPPLP